MQKTFGRMRGFVCMIHTMKLLIRKQIGQRRTNIIYGMKCMRQQGMNFILIDGWNMLKMAEKKKMIWY